MPQFSVETAILAGLVRRTGRRWKENSCGWNGPFRERTLLTGYAAHQFGLDLAPAQPPYLIHYK